MIIPESVIEIGEAAFIWCTKLKAVYIPDSVKVIGERAFKSCIELSTVNIPDSLSAICHRTFYECDSLTSITIPENTTLIESEAFDHCRNLKTVFCKAKTPPKCLNITFYSTDITLYVPTESLELYKSTPEWGNYIKHIVGYNFNR